MRILWNSKAAMVANQDKLDAISNNIANINTTGYKRVEVSFKDLMSETLDRTGYPTNSDSAYTGTGVRITEPYRDDTQGKLLQTGLKTDIAIDGQGYFRVTKFDGSYGYTRDGSFTIDRDGKLVNAAGDVLELEFNEGYSYENLKLSEEAILINYEGELSVKDGETVKTVAVIPLYNTLGGDTMISTGENTYAPKEGATVYRTSDAELYQGYLEGSNVDLSEEITELILTQRAFQLGTKAMETADQMRGMINNLRSR